MYWEVYWSLGCSLERDREVLKPLFSLSMAFFEVSSCDQQYTPLMCPPCLDQGMKSLRRKQNEPSLFLCWLPQVFVTMVRSSSWDPTNLFSRVPGCSISPTQEEVWRAHLWGSKTRSFEWLTPARVEDGHTRSSMKRTFISSMLWPSAVSSNWFPECGQPSWKCKCLRYDFFGKPRRFKKTVKDFPVNPSYHTPESLIVNSPTS